MVVETLGSSSVDLKVRMWINSAERRLQARYSVVEASKLALDEAGIEIPFPHLQLFLDTVEDRVWQGAEQPDDQPESRGIMRGLPAHRCDLRAHSP